MAERKIEFGTTLRTPDNIEALAQQIEGLNDIIGCGEHVSFHGDSANGFNRSRSRRGSPTYPPDERDHTGAALSGRPVGKAWRGTRCRIRRPLHDGGWCRR